MDKQGMIRLWEQHVAREFQAHDAEATVETMLPDSYVNHVPVLAGGCGRDGLREFYARDFIPGLPPDITVTLVSRTVGEEQLVDEMIVQFTHSQPMPWMLPGVAPTHRRVRVPVVGIIRFRDGKLAHEHIYWDQASVLKQIGLLTDPALPVHGPEEAEMLVHPRFERRSERP